MSANIPEEKPINPRPEDSHSKESDQKPPNTAPPIVTEPYVPPPKGNDHHAKRKKNSGLDWARFVVEVLTLFALVWYACIASRQLIEMHNATVAATNGASAATSAANTAQQTLQATVEQFHLDQRAWLGAEALSGPIELNKDFVITIFFRNSGKTPARKVSAGAGIKAVKKGEQIDFTYDNTPVISRGLTPPNGTFNVFRSGTAGKLATQADLNAVTSKDVTIYFYGKITYEDVFSKPHWLTFCAFLMNDQKNYQYCPQYNDTGDGAPPH